MLDLTPIKARLTAATPGPWERYAYVVGAPGHYTICRMLDGTTTNAPPAGLDAAAHVAQDCTFIAHAPQDMTVLIEEVERLRMALDTIGTSIYTQGRGTKMEQSLLKFIREQLGRS